MELMKAAVYEKYGPPEVLQIKEINKPAPKDNEILIKIYAATVTAGDCETRRFKIPLMFWLPIRLYMGLLKPRVKILGQEFAGEIEITGKNVTLFKKGDKVFGATGMKLGAYAEFTCLPESYAIAIKQDSLNYEEAVTIPVGGLNALFFLKKANIKNGQHVLINGACGSIGSFAVQYAKLLGAEVTAVDSTDKLDTLYSIGANHVIDYTKEDFTKNGKKYEVIFDVAGKSSFARSVKSLKKEGYYLLANPRLWKIVLGLFVLLTGRKKIITGVASERIEDLIYLNKLIEEGKIKPVIDRTYSLEQIIEAHKYVEQGHKKGNVVITI